ncbi:MAG: DHHA1 domain-containing protein [Methermicoccaceae archaeon]
MAVKTHRLEDIKKRAELCAKEILKHDEVLVVSHIDADGVTSAAITLSTLERVGITGNVHFAKQLDMEILEAIASEEGKDTLVIFTDLGSGVIDKIEALNINAVVVDHHVPVPSNYPLHLNPCLFGIDGSYQASGSTMSYLLAGSLTKLAQGLRRRNSVGGGGELSEDKKNLSIIDLSPLAVVGAMGDLQHVKMRRLVSLNRLVLKQGAKYGYLSYAKDLSLFGKQTRPLFKLLQFSTDPVIPGLTGREDACIDFLKGCGITMKGERWRCWVDLTTEEKQRVVSALLKHCIAHGLPPSIAEELVGEVYVLEREDTGSELRDASEYSTLLNSTARYDKAEVGLAVCMGDRGTALARARTLLNEHRRNLVDGLSFVKETGVSKRSSFVYFDAGSRIKDTIVGIIAGMSMSFVGHDLPVIAFADGDDGNAKVSARATQSVAHSGINLAHALSEASSKVGGMGGGHPVAAGATIPMDKKEEFLNILESVLNAQKKMT